jgi:glycosyltransferase involved in cell wall biosynthesis
MELQETYSFTTVVDVIIPSFNNYSSLIKTLRSLEQQTVSNFFVYICIDGASEEIEQKLPNERLTLQYRVMTHPNNEHRGRNATRNLALPYVKSDYIITIDSDAVASPTLIEEHLKVVSNNVISVGMFCYTNTNDNLWAKYLSTRGNSKRHHLDEIPYYYFKTGNVCFPSSYFIQLGGQDEQMKHYGGGDTEFSIRIYNTFHPKYVNNSKAIVFSEMDKEIKTALEQFFEFGAINLPYILQKHPSEQQIFSIDKLLNNRLYFHVLKLPITSLFIPILSILPSFLQERVLHLCVASQIVRGYSSRVKV